MQWHQLDHMQTSCNSLQTDKDNCTNTSLLNFYRPDIFATPNRQCQSTEGKAKCILNELKTEKMISAEGQGTEGIMDGRHVMAAAQNDWVCIAQAIDVKKRFFYVFYSGHVFYFPNVFYFKKRWQNSERQAD